MTIQSKALIWAAAILMTAFLMKTMGTSDGGYFTVIAALSGTAVASLYGKRRKACGS